MLQDAWQIGRVLGIPLRLHVSWLVGFGLISWSLAGGYFPAVLPDLPVWSYWLKAILAAALLFASIVLHELGHSVVARRHGIEIASITLFIFGGIAHLKSEPRQARQEFQIAIAGPLVSVGLAALFWVLGVLARDPAGVSAATALFGYVAMINLFLVLFNMLPVFPLDGGRVLRAVVWRWRGSFEAATRTAVATGRFFAFAMIALGIVQILSGRFGGLWLVFIGWFVLQAGGASLAQVTLKQAFGALRVRDVMATDLKVVPAGATLQSAVEDFFVRHTFGGYPVVDDGRVVGLLTLRELRGVSPEARASTPVRSVMSPLESALTVSPETPVVDALARMAGGRGGRLLVMDQGRLAGLVTANGILHLAQVKAALQN